MLFVHIGWPKAGSTTIQRFLVVNRVAIRDRGVVYSEVGRGKNGHLALVRALRHNRLGEIEEFERELRREPHLNHMISSEHFFQLQPAAIHRLLQHTGGHEVRIIVYVRDYASWIRSWYGQRTKKGLITDDFDTVFETALPRASFMPALTTWGEELGWDKMRIRSLDRENLHRQNLVDDALNAVGVEYTESMGAQRPEDQNTALPWYVVEFCRALAVVRPAGHDVTKIKRTEKRLLDELTAFLATGVQVPDASYLTPQQVERATRRFNEDVALINERTGSKIPQHQPARTPDRPFLPSFEMVPSDVREKFFNKLDRSVLRRFVPKNERRGLQLVREYRDSLRAAYLDHRAEAKLAGQGLEASGPSSHM